MCRKFFLPCPCAAPCSELPGSGRAVWVVDACTPPEKGNEEMRRWVNPQRDRYVMERLTEDYFEEERGRKEEERLSHTHWNKQEGESNQ